MLSDDPFCVRHGVPFDAFEGCWRCASDAAEREKAKREVSNEKDAEIARLRALVESAESSAKLHFEAAEEMRAALAAKTLRAETVIAARECLSVAWRDSVWGTKRIAELSDAIADLDRCYPPEEV